MRLQAPSAPKKNLCSLLGYAEEILKAGEPIVSDLTKHAVAVFHETDVAHLEGVSVPTPDEVGLWLRVERLRENLAPDPDEAYAAWMAPQPASAGAFGKPRLSQTCLVHVDAEDASNLLEAGLAAPEDVMKPKGDRARGGGFDILMRLERLPEFAAAFDAWVEGPWSAWETAERPRRRSVAFYNRLFEIQQRASSMGDDAAVEALFGVGLARWEKVPGTRVNAPLVEASVELELDPDDGAILVRARSQPPRLALRPFDDLEIPGVGRLHKEASTQLERLHGDPDTAFSPHDRQTFEQVLRMCHARLAADAVYEPDARSPSDRGSGAFDDKLRITDTWVLYVRARSSNFRCEDIKRLAEAIEAVEEADLPAAGIQLTMQPTDAPIGGDLIDLNARPGTDFRGDGNPGSARQAEAPGDAGREMFFFPLPYNDEQVEIARRLERDDTAGVVVQGPPGTGKTHTIANIIAHYMATGRRILVSAHQPEALAAIRGKLPETIRDLAISVIHSDREGARRLEAAVNILANQVKQIDRDAYNRRRLQLEADLDTTRSALADADAKLREHARTNLAAVEFRGERLVPMHLAARVEAERAQHAWLADVIDMSPRFDPLFGDGEIVEARRLRQELGRDLAYSEAELPEQESLPDIPRLLAAHDALAREKETERLRATGELPYVSFSASAGVAEAEAAHAWLEDAAGWLAEIEARQHGWLANAYRLLVAPTADQVHARTALIALFAEWASLAEEGGALALAGVDAGSAPLSDAKFDAAVEALCAGRKAFGAISIGKAGTKAQVAAVRVGGAPPKDAAAWATVRSHRVWQRQAQAFLGRWAAAAAVGGYPTGFGRWPDASVHLIQVGTLAGRMRRLHTHADGHARAIRLLFPYGVDPHCVVVRLELSPAREALASSLKSEGLAEARALRQRLLEFGGSCPRPFHSALLQLAGCLGDAAIPARQLAEGWRVLLDEAGRLGKLRRKRQRLSAIAGTVALSGARRWAAALLAEPWSDDDAWTPPSWRKSWEWARADGHVRALSDPRAQAALTSGRRALDARCGELLAELVMVRTYIGLKQGITERVASSLQKFAMKVRQLGAGTGKAAERHRRGIREATLEAASAVPCWILPEWRVAEQLPSELGAFDLVIVDEASQSDITSLPAVLRGRKVLIVGDDKQVSPSAVGMEERTVVQLRETFLRGMGVANFLEPTTSLYDLASMTFPGSVIMLREHFRCVEPIIAFSSRFYPKALIPLRVPTSEERLDPPLVDVYIPHGRKVRDTNPAEAEFIVSEIASLVAQPEYAGRTIGVVSLIGDKQAKLVQDRLVDAIGTELIAKHRIMCGNASTFQGQERDVMFLSMVACPTTARSQTARLMEQRFNVAMSRARDRMYLVRSVAASMLQQADLKSAVIEHFRNPSIAAAGADKSILDETESPFEREVAELLVGRGYRIRPQVPVGGYRIDIAVEGEGGRRLAVELDGDRFHGPERWFEDMHRQRALERLGWTFWRCWGSHWFAARQECIDDLAATLARLGIEPMAGDAAAQNATEHRIVGSVPEEPTADAVPEADIVPDAEADAPPSDAASAEKTVPTGAGDADTADAFPAQGTVPTAAPPPARVASPAPVRVPGMPRQPELELGVQKRPQQPELELAGERQTSEAPAPAPAAEAPRLPEPSATAASTVEIGDTVIVRFADNNQVRRFRLTASNNDPDRGEVSAGQAIAKALLGNGIDEEVGLTVGGRERLVVIEKITKAA